MDWQGVSVPKAHVRYEPPLEVADTAHDTTGNPKNNNKKKKMKCGGKKPAHLQQEGPLLVTHHEVSGPAILQQLRAFGAQDFHQANYQHTLIIHWAPDLGTVEDITNAL